jgi:hypothetical protein
MARSLLLYRSDDTGAGMPVLLRYAHKQTDALPQQE